MSARSHAYPFGYMVGGLGAQARGRCQTGRVIVPFFSVFNCRTSSVSAENESVLPIKQSMIWRSPVGHFDFSTLSY